MSCSRARGAGCAGVERAAPAVRRARLRRPLPAADPPDRPDQPQGRQQRADRRARRPGLAVGDRRRQRRPRRRSTRSSGRSRTSRSSSRAAARHGIDIALDFAIQCSADHPWLTEHPEWFHHRPDGTLKYAENPPKRYQDIYNVNCDCADWRALWNALLEVVLLLGRPRRQGVPRRQPAHQAVRRSGQWLIERGARARPRRHLPRRGVHAPRRDAAPREARLQPVLHLLHLEELALRADRVRDRARLLRRSASTSGRTSSPTRPTSSTSTSSTAGRPAFEARLVLAATLSPSYGIYSGFERIENVPVRPGSEEYLDSEKYELKERALDGELLPLISQLNQHPPREPGAPGALATSPSSTTENDALIAYAKRTPGSTDRRRRQPRPPLRPDGSRLRSRGADRRAARSPSTTCSPASTSSGSSAQLRPPRAGRAPGSRPPGSAVSDAVDTPASVGSPVICRRRSAAGAIRAVACADTPVVRGRPALVQARRLLRDPHPRLLRRQRRRLRRFPRAHREARLPPVARDRLHLAAAVLRLAAARRRLRHLRLLRRASRLRHGRGRQAADRRGPRPADPRDRRPRHEPHLERPPVVPGVALEPGLAQARLVRVVGRPTTATRTRGSSSPTPRRRTGPGTRSPAPTTGTASSPPARPQLRQPGGPGGDARRPALLARPRSRRLPPRRGPVPVRARGDDLREPAETHAYLKRVRETIDAEYPDRVLLAEANQWPEDVVEYFGDGDECHMAFHFPVMPRMFMAARREDATPIYEILERTPDIPDSCQWGLFLRNHDELTLEMVTDEERDYMYAEYAKDPRMKINVGIRRRLAPLLDNGRDEIELMTAILFSLPGLPGPLLRRRDRHGRQRLPRRPRRGADADAVDRGPQRRLLPGGLRRALRPAADGPGVRLPGGQRRGAAAHADLAAALAAPLHRAAQGAPRVRARHLRADPPVEPEDLRPRPPVRGRDHSCAPTTSRARRRRSSSISARSPAVIPSSCSGAPTSRRSASSPTC